MFAHSLKTELQCAPINIDTSSPRLSWQSASAEKDAVQTAYQIRVARAVTALESPGTCGWDSRRVNSSNPRAVYMGIPLRSEASYFWKVRLWDNHNQCGPWSEAVAFETALLTGDDWQQAQWIAHLTDHNWAQDWEIRKQQEVERAPNSHEFKFPLSTSDQLDPWQLRDLTDPPYDPAPLLLREFTIRRGIRSARLHISGLGYYVAEINGQRVGDQVLDPGWTNYHRTVLYTVHDVTEMLRLGENAISVLLGRGFYGQLANDIWGFHNSPWLGQPCLKAKLVVKYTHGLPLVLVTDGKWRTADSHIQVDDPRLGELHGPQTHPISWTPAHTVTGPAGTLISQKIPPIRAVAYRLPVAVTHPGAETARYDFGENISGWAEIRTRGPEGTRVLTRYAEQPEGDDLYDKVVNGYQQAGFTLDGKDDQMLAPQFSYKAFRYLQVDAPPDVIANSTVTGVHIHSDITSTGRFSCSNPLLNRIQAMWRLTQLNNMHSIPTDCPHREKLGWMADAFIAQQAAMYNFEMTGFYEKYVQDVADTSDTNGLLSVIAPAGNYSQGVSAVWSSALILIPWQLYQFTGDPHLLVKHFPAMLRLIRATESHQTVPDKPHIITERFGDWANPAGNIPPEGTWAYGTAYHYQNCRIVADIARLLGDESTALALDSLAEEVRSAFNTAFFDADQCIYHGDKETDYRQAVNAIALAFDLAPDSVRGEVFHHLCADIEAKDRHLDTGLIGTPALLDVLHRFGRPDLAYALVTQRTYPGWGFMLDNGATTMWETWDGRASHNHPMFGCVIDYLYRRLAGIQVDKARPGFDHVIIAPEFANDLDEVQAETQTNRGTVLVHWQRQDRQLSMDVNIPANMSATLRLPVASMQGTVTEGKSVVWNAGDFVAQPGITAAAMQQDRLWLELGSGEYTFYTSVEEG